MSSFRPSSTLGIVGALEIVQGLVPLILPPQIVWADYKRKRDIASLIRAAHRRLGISTRYLNVPKNRFSDYSKKKREISWSSLLYSIQDRLELGRGHRDISAHLLSTSTDCQKPVRVLARFSEPPNGLSLTDWMDEIYPGSAGPKSTRELERFRHSFRDYISALDNFEDLVIYHQFNPLARIMEEELHSLSRVPLFLEGGLLPGSFTLDIGGQAGFSDFARHSETFNRLPLAPEDVSKSHSFIHDCIKNRTSHKVGEVRLGSGKKRSGRPVVTFLASADPHTELAYRHHIGRAQPELHSSALIQCLSMWADQQDVEFRVKPHPLFTRYRLQIPEALQPRWLGESVDIWDVCQASDVVITNVSKSAFYPLALHKPTLVSALHPLANQDFVQTFSTQRQLEGLLDVVLGQKIAPNANKFEVYVARLMRYGVFFPSNQENGRRYLSEIEYVKAVRRARRANSGGGGDMFDVSQQLAGA